MDVVSLASLATSLSSADIGARSTVIVAARALSQMKEDGATALALIQSSAPPTGDHRGQMVNVMA